MGSGLDGEVDSLPATYSCIALAKRFHLSEPQFPHLQNGDTYSIHIGLW